MPSRAWELLIEKIADVLASFLNDNEMEATVAGFIKLFEKVRELSSKLKELELKSAHLTYCKHQGRCRQNCIRGFLHAFTAAYGVKYAVGLIQALFSGKLQRSPGMILSLLDRDTLRFAMFFGCFIGGFKGINCLLRRLREKEDHWNGFIAGSLAGTALFIDSKSRRKAVALYLSTRSLQVLFNYLRAKEKIPSIPRGEVLLMALCNVQIMYAFICYPTTLAKSYYNWIFGMADFTHYHGKKGAREVAECIRCIGLEQPAPQELLRPALERSEKILAATGVTGEHSSLFCALVHPDKLSCTMGTLAYSTRCFPKALRLYLPLNLAMSLFWRHNVLLKNPRKFLYHLMKSSLRSSAFITLFASLAWLPPCYFRSLIGRDWQGSFLVNGFISGSTVIMEEPYNRRIELALYCVPRAMESFWNLAVLKGYLKPIRNGEVLLFSLAMGVLMTIYQNERDIIPKNYEHIFIRFFGKN